MTEPLLTDFQDALLAYIEDRASNEQRQVLEKRMLSEPALQAQVLAMIADRRQLQAVPRSAMPHASQSRQAVLECIQRERRNRRVLANIRYGSMAAAALLLASAISFRIIWPASTVVLPTHNMLAVSSIKRGMLRSQSSKVPFAANSQQRAALSASPTITVAAGPAQLAARSIAAPAAPWTLVIAVKTSTQDRQLHALLAKFARQNRQPMVTSQPELPHRAAMKAAATKALLENQLATPATQARPSPQSRNATTAHHALRALPAGDLVLMLKPAQVQLLRSQFTVVRWIAPSENPSQKNQRPPTSALGFRLAKAKQAKKYVPPTAHLALQRLQINKSIALRPANKLTAPTLPTQAQQFIIEILPPHQR